MLVSLSTPLMRCTAIFTVTSVPVDCASTGVEVVHFLGNVAPGATLGCFSRRLSFGRA